GCRGSGGSHGVPPPCWLFRLQPSYFHHPPFVARLPRVSATPPGSTPGLPSVRRALGFRGVGLDLEHALRRWRAAGHDGDERAFVAWILAELESDAVMVTEVLPPRLAAARAQPALEATIVGVPGPVEPAAAEEDATFVEAPDAPL